MGKISQLLRYKKEVPLTDKGKELAKVWIRIIGDDDLNECYKLARLRSSEIRRKLRKEDTTEYKDELSMIDDATKEELIEVIKASRQSQFSADAISQVERPDEIEIAEIALDPDAASLEELELLDEKNNQQDKDYNKALDDYIEARTTALVSELENSDLDTLKKLAKEETINVIALTTFFTELQAEKVWRAVYEDKELNIRAFQNREEYNESAATIKNQLIGAYTQLEISPEEIKN